MFNYKFSKFFFATILFMFVLFGLWSFDFVSEEIILFIVALVLYFIFLVKLDAWSRLNTYDYTSKTLWAALHNRRLSNDVEYQIGNFIRFQVIKHLPRLIAYIKSKLK